MFVRDPKELGRVALLLSQDDVEKARKYLRMSRETYLALYGRNGPLYPVQLSQSELNAREARRF